MFIDFQGSFSPAHCALVVLEARAMWGLPVLTRWPRWPTRLPPELHVALAAPGDVVALPGSQAAGPRGRYGVVGLPARVQRLTPGDGVIACALDDRPACGLRVVLFGYELGAPEVFLDPEQPPPGQPAGLAIDLDAALIVDHQEETCALVGQPSERADALARLFAVATVERPIGRAILEPTVSDSEHSRRIGQALEHIMAGDIYQANLARPLKVRGRFDAPPALAALALRNPVAHAAFLRIGDFELLSNSMETLLTFEPEKRLARSFPIKGTAGRATNAESDRKQADRLAIDPKERAEHVMIVDLVRNDLGKLATPGSVRVPQLMHLSPYRGVWHGVSMVEATLKPEATVGQLAAALFPGGSITGAPKRRAMQIIRELEGAPRGSYTGSLGVVTPEGRLSMSILIRTLVRDQAGWSVSVGGGIVADSKPEREIAETWEKVAVFRELLAGRSERRGDSALTPRS